MYVGLSTICEGAYEVAMYKSVTIVADAQLQAERISGSIPEYPIEVNGDTLWWTFVCSATEELWGFRFTVTPKFPPLIIQEREEAAQAQVAQSLRDAPSWSPLDDVQMVSFVNRAGKKVKGKGIAAHLTISLEDVDMTHLALFPRLSRRDRESLRPRLAVLQKFNDHVARVLPLVDVTTVEDSTSLMFSLAACRSYILSEVKNEFLNHVLDISMLSQKRPVLSLSRRKGESPSKMFLKAYSLLNKINPSLLKSPIMSFEAKFEGEGGQDVGGIFREAMTYICQGFLSPEVGLFKKVSFDWIRHAIG